jgi:hypothetical protein
VAAPDPTSARRRGLKLRNMWQCRSSPLGEAEPGAMGHVAALEPTSAGRRGPELRNAWRHQSSTQQGDETRGHGPRGSTGAHLSKEVRSGAAGHVAAPKPTSVGRCGPKLYLMWQRVDARLAPCLDLDLICGGTRSSGYQQIRTLNFMALYNDNEEKFKHEKKAELLWQAYKERLGTSEFTQIHFSLNEFIQEVHRLEDLIRPFSTDEIDNIDHNLPLGKSPGPDDFNTAFYKEMLGNYVSGLL